MAAGEAPVMVRRLGGLSDREPVDRHAFAVRWRHAAGIGGYGGGGWSGLAQTVLVDMRAPGPDPRGGLQAAHPTPVWSAGVGWCPGAPQALA